MKLFLKERETANCLNHLDKKLSVLAQITLLFIFSEYYFFAEVQVVMFED